MSVYFNRRMRTSAKIPPVDLGSDDLPAALASLPYEFPDKVADLVESPVVEKEGCSFLAPLLPQKIDLEQLGDRTGCECFYNHFHIEDSVKKHWSDTVPTHTLVNVGLKATGVLYQHLTRQLGERNFWLISGFSEDSATLRFHRKRAGEFWIDPDELHRYQGEGILILTR